MLTLLDSAHRFRPLQTDLLLMKRAEDEKKRRDNLAKAYVIGAAASGLTALNSCNAVPLALPTPMAQISQPPSRPPSIPKPAPGHDPSSAGMDILSDAEKIRRRRKKKLLPSP
jgi:hypothetical protein